MTDWQTLWHEFKVNIALDVEETDEHCLDL
jgi:hypothetical protein